MFSSPQASPVQSIFVALILTMLGLLVVAMIKSPDRKYLTRLFAFAFFIRVIFVYIIYYYLIGVGGDGFAFTDDRTYDLNARIIAKALNKGQDGYDIFSWHQNPGYFYFNGWLYSLLGTDTFSSRVVNAFLSSLTVIFIFEIARNLFELKVAKIAGLLAAFMPSMIYWSALQFKDTSLIFVMVFASYLLVVKRNQRVTITSIVLMIGALALMWTLRKDYALPYIGIVFIWLILRYTGLEKWFNNLRKKGLSVVVGGFMLIIGGGVIVGLSNSSAGQIFLAKYDKVTGNNAEFVEKASAAQIGFSRHLRINSVSDMYKLPFAVSFTTILPLPSFSNLIDGKRAGLALYSMANLAFVMLLPFVALGFVLTKTVSLGDSIILRWFPLTVLVGVSIVFMGVLRYKEQLMPFFLIWAALALSEKSKYRNKLGMIYLIGFFSVITAVIVASTTR